jgi:hypothetical protein
MNSPLILIERRLPRELVNIIQSYIRNDIVHTAVSNYLSYLLSERDLYMQYMYETHVMKQCYCHTMSSRNLRVYDGCDYCNWFERLEFDEEYIPSAYSTCIENNNQYRKLLLDT